MPESPLPVGRHSVRDRFVDDAPQNTKPDFFWYWLSPSNSRNEGEIFLKTSGWDGEWHWTGAETIPADSPFFPAWRWIRANAHALPRLITAQQARSLIDLFDSCTTMTNLEVPPDGAYLLTPGAPPPWTLQLLARDLADVEVSMLDISTLYPGHPHVFLRSLLGNEPALFYYADGECAYSCNLHDQPESMRLSLRQLREELDRRTKTG